jgi:energy-coupling factor transport system ATP-binding protein
LLTPRRAAPALEAEGLGYRYAGGREALREVSLSIGAGEFVLLAGRSASGKTTLLRAACGLVPHFHGGELAGTVTVAGMDTAVCGPGELAAAVGYVAQEPESQVVSTTVAAEIELPLELRGEPASGRARAVEEVALALAIPHLLERTTDTLSGGELQRVALAAALVTRPKLVLLDEPTSQLDPVAGDELVWLLRRLNEEWGVSVLLAEHRLERCLAAADRVIAMESGTIVFDGSPRDFLAWSLDHDTALTTPAARLFSIAGISPLPVGVRDARDLLRATGRMDGSVVAPPERLPRGESPRSGGSRVRVRQGSGGPPTTALRARDLWVELGSETELRDVIKGIDLDVGRGERVALMGRNGAGKSTLLRAAAGVVESVHGRIEVPGGMALLTQSPGDFLVRERVHDELPGEAGREALAAVGLGDAGERDPRDLSGGERQRLALAIALAGREGEGAAGLVGLDEPTRGMDRARKEDLTGLIGVLAGRGSAVLVATHDVEFAAAFAERVVLLGDGRVIADGPAAEILSGGWYFATEVARVLDLAGVVTPEQGAAMLDKEEEER